MERQVPACAGATPSVYAFSSLTWGDPRLCRGDRFLSGVATSSYGRSSRDARATGGSMPPGRPWPADPRVGGGDAGAAGVVRGWWLVLVPGILAAAGRTSEAVVVQANTSGLKEFLGLHP